MSPFVIILVITGIILFFFLIKRMGAKHGNGRNVRDFNRDSGNRKWTRSPGNFDTIRKANQKRGVDRSEAFRKRNEVFRKQVEANQKRAADNFEAFRKRSEMFRKQNEEINKANRKRMRGF
jgi:hypothetical protein